jgi:hypothetical protein
MWEPWRLTTLWAFMACYRDSFIIVIYIDVHPLIPVMHHNDGLWTFIGMKNNVTTSISSVSTNQTVVLFFVCCTISSESYIFNCFSGIILPGSIILFSDGGPLYETHEKQSLLRSCQIWGSHSSGCEEFCLLGYNAMQMFESQLTFWRNLSSKKPAGSSWQERSWFACQLLHASFLLDPPKCWLTFQNTELFIITATRTSNPTNK